MDIQLGKMLGKPRAIIYFYGSKMWSGTIKIHLKNSMKMLMTSYKAKEFLSSN
jgi:hypothetical protein